MVLMVLVLMVLVVLVLVVLVLVVLVVLVLMVLVCVWVRRQRTARSSGCVSAQWTSPRRAAPGAAQRRRQ